VIQSDSKIEEDLNRKLKKKGKNLEREREIKKKEK